jgi:hypothetical protein
MSCRHDPASGPGVIVIITCALTLVALVLCVVLR